MRHLIARFRNRTRPSCPLPESAKAILRYDRNFRLFGPGAPLLRPLLARPGQVVPSADIDRIVRREAFHERARSLFARLPAGVPVWNDDRALPACIELARPGDQRLFLYAGELDGEGEFPIARFDDEPCVWITEASLIHLVVDVAIESGVKIECSIDFEAQLKKAVRRHGKHQERWSRDPRVAQLVATV